MTSTGSGGRGSGGTRGKKPGSEAGRGTDINEKKEEVNAEGVINLTDYIEGIRAERVMRLKSDIERGVYNVDAEKVAERIIRRAARVAHAAVRNRGGKKRED